MSALYIILISLIFISICPIFCSVFITLDKNKKSLKAEITVFGISFFRVNVVAKDFKIYVKQSFKRPYFITVSPKYYKPMKFPKIKRISVISVTTCLNCGIDNDAVVPLTTASAINVVNNIICSRISAKKPFFKAQNEINIFLGENNFTALLKVNAVFNLLDIIYNLFINLSEKIRYAIGK